MNCLTRSHIFSMFLCLCVVETAFGQSASQPCQLAFQNPKTGTPIRFRLLPDSDGTLGHPVQLNDDDRPLGPGRQRIFDTFPGMVWQIIDANQGTQLAVYVASEFKKQNVNVVDLIVASAPVKLSFKNTTDAPISIFQMENTDSIGSMIAGLYSYQNTTISLVRVSGGKIRWTAVDGNDGSELFELNRSQDRVSLLSDSHGFDCIIEGGEVKGLNGHGITFKRVGDTSSGILVAENVPPGRRLNIDLGDRSPGPMPGSSWRILQDGKFYADYIADATSDQIVDVREQGTWFLPVSVVFQNNTGSPLKVHFVDVSGKAAPILKDSEGYENTLAPGQWVSQPTRPFNLFRIQSDRDPRQRIDIPIDNREQQVFKITNEVLSRSRLSQSR